MGIAVIHKVICHPSASFQIGSPLQSLERMTVHMCTIVCTVQYPCRHECVDDDVSKCVPTIQKSNSSHCSLSRKELPLQQIMEKVEVVPGDLAQPQCGISPENQERLLPEVHYVIHAAASIQFDNPIHTDLTLSYVATKTIADFAAKVMCPYL